MSHKNKTVVKSMDLLNLFRLNPRMSLNELVELTGSPKTSVHRMAGSLEEMGFLQRDGNGVYELGFVFLEFGQLVAERLDIRRAALPAMRQLRDEVEEAVNLTIRDGDESIYIEKLESTRPVRLYTKIGRRAPLYAGACSRILLAHMPETEAERYLERTELVPIAAGTITDVVQLRSLLAESRRCGYSLSHSELENDTSALAAPIFDYTGRIAGGLSVAGPDSRFRDERLPELSEKVRSAAERISRELGWKRE
ncbi:IclR family transcriptional regulator [Saccharibacillus kuerlensis]|uniref:HTH-type transcriptional regulator KipR n=1 Tax=Saccharibacillus kuerlensis TaxID=459527 RepID=A0ABQ2L614_9BACL|nr:IclR family transcriptional regulator [Saccharibacillus kuerlensis]GGO04795.1 HTH-type transcriptional regulator KipR [Saccharibacillus kuerlensis]